MSSVILSDITKFYGNIQIIYNFSNVFNDHEFITLLGPSGCGKTTLLRMVAGFEKPSSGEIKIGEKIVSSQNKFIPPEDRGIGMVFQSYAVWPHMNVFENVAYPLRIKKFSKNEINDRVKNILEAVHLSEYINRMPNELSGGQQQRVALARALVSEPGVLLLDEPLSNLDAKLREFMRFEIKEMQKKFGITVIYVTHDQNEAMAMSDRIIVLNAGKVQQVGTPLNIYNKPVNKFVADFVGRVNFLNATAEAENGIIKFTDGQFIKYSGDNYKFKSGKIILAVRPENIKINNDSGMLRGKLINSYYLGDINDCRINIGNGNNNDNNNNILRVFLPGNTYGKINADSEIYLNFDDYIIFDGDNE